MTWLELSDDELFGIDNLPYGIFSIDGDEPRVGTRIGNHVLDLAATATAFDMELADIWRSPTLNRFLAQPSRTWQIAREWITDILTNPSNRPIASPHLHTLDVATMHLPISVSDYVDFYASEHHAANVGQIFRPDSEPLTPNWKHLPIGYHGRAGSVVVSGTNIIRPSGQFMRAGTHTPTFGPSTRLDIECELGFVVGGSSDLGRPVNLEDADEHLFGALILNDWSARDIQAWEYVPLGPFLGKSFATSISPWVVTMAALRSARWPLQSQNPSPLPYLRGTTTNDGGNTAYGLNINFEVEWNGTLVSRPNFRDIYWSPAQMLAHMTVNGASIRPGDLFASGTISGSTRDSRGSFLELAWGGRDPITLDDGSERTFLADGDTVTIRAIASGTGGQRLGFGSCTGTIFPSQVRMTR